MVAMNLGRWRDVSWALEIGTVGSVMRMLACVGFEIGRY